MLQSFKAYGKVGENVCNEYDKGITSLMKKGL